MDAWTVPRLCIDDRGRLVVGAIYDVGRRALVERGSLEGRVAQNPLGGAQERGYVRSENELRPVRRSARLNVHLGPADSGTGDLITEGRHLAQSRPENEQSIGRIQPCPEALRSSVSGHAEIERVIVWKDVGTAPRRDNWNAHSLREPNEGIRAASAQNPRAGQDERPTCVGKQMEDLAHERRVRLGGGVRAGGVRGFVPTGGGGGPRLHA